MSYIEPFYKDQIVFNKNYRDFQLIAGFQQEYCYGQIWKDKITISSFDGTDLEIIIENLYTLVDIILEKNT